MAMTKWITPHWRAPAPVRALVTTRAGGVSRGDYASLNLSLHVGDDEQQVLSNRASLRQGAHLPGEPVWLEQVHGKRVLELDPSKPIDNLQADAAVALMPEQVCVVLTADCFPVLFCDKAGTRVGVAHVGWKGLVAGVLEETIAKLKSSPTELLAWIGPGISAIHFRIEDSVRGQLLSKNSAFAMCCLPDNTGKWTADLLNMIVLQLHACGVSEISGGKACTYSEPQTFFSYRYHQRCGRMASLIWLAR